MHDGRAHELWVEPLTGYIKAITLLPFPHQRKICTEGLLGQHAFTCHNMYCGERTLQLLTSILTLTLVAAVTYPQPDDDVKIMQPPGSLYHLHILSLLDLHMAAPLLCLWLLSKQIYSLNRLKYNYYYYSETFINFVSIHVCHYSNKVMCVQ